MSEAVNCGQPKLPINGRLFGNVFTFSHSVRYQCKDGYKLGGNVTRTCLATGNWSGSVPSCTGI